MRQILLVDDDHGAIRALERELKSSGKYWPWACTSAAAALDLAEHKQFDLVISD